MIDEQDDAQNAALVPPEDIRAATAVHEAGHAVAAYVMGLPFTYATVSPNPELQSLGHVEGAVGSWMDANVKTLQRQRELAYADAVLFLAGPLAEARVSDIEPNLWRVLDRSEEYEMAESTLRDVYVSERRVQERMHDAYHQTQQLLAEEWNAVIMLASALHKWRKIDYADACRIIHWAEYETVEPATIKTLAAALGMTPDELIG